MATDEPEQLRCKFCGGVLRPDLPKNALNGNFKFFRCDECEASNVFAVRLPPFVTAQA